jgi:hypothetical protein
VMLENVYKLCIEAEVHLTNYKFAGDEPIMAAYARRAAEINGGEE